MKVIWAERAVHDLEQIYNYISQDDPKAALQVITFIRETAHRLTILAERGKPGRWLGTRELVMTTYGYTVVYRVEREDIEILTVLHQARDWPTQSK